MDKLERRTRLRTTSNPAKQSDYLVDLKCPPVSLRYIPDKVVLDPDCLEPYLSALQSGAPVRAEELAAMILDDLNNELVPRWVHVRVSASDRHIVAHDVIMEEHQPNWENQNLISRLTLI